MSGDQRETSQVAQRLAASPAMGPWRHMLTEGACCPPPLWELFQASLLMRDQNQLTAVAEGEPRAHTSGEGHKEKLLPWLIGFQPQAAGSWDEEILVLQHHDIK